jgi:hypothetical protein
LLALSFVMVGCSEPTSVSDAVTVNVNVSPREVSVGALFAATLTIHNVSTKAVTLVSGDSCVAVIQVYLNDERVDLDGTSWGCFTVVTEFRIPAGEALTRSFTLRALAAQSEAPWEYVVAPAPGTYEVRMEMHVNLPDASGEMVIVR